MKALVLEAPDKPLVVKDVTQPQITEADDVLVQVKAAALNHRDRWITIGKYAGIKYPSILGSDCAGIVAGVGSGVDAAWLGKEVVINPSNNWGDNPAFQGKDFKILGLPDDGAFAQYVKTKAKYLHVKPMHLSFEQAAAFPLAGLTAYRALFTKGHATTGDTVLITGVGSGTGLFALQWAIAAGCRVFVTSGSADKIARAVQMGAAGGANYKTAGWDTNLLQLSGGFDVVVDSALGEGFAKLPDICKPGARIVFFGGTAGDIPAINGRKIFWKQLQILGTTMGTADEFEAMIGLINQHQIVPVVDDVFALDDAGKALSKMSSSAQFGKLILKI